MKVKYKLPPNNLIKHHVNRDFTIDKWYGIIWIDNGFTPSYYIKNDSGFNVLIPNYYFITEEEDRDNKLSEILSES